MFYKKSKLSAVVLAQICLSTSVHAPIVTVSLLSGESILEKEFGDDISIAQLTKSVEKEFRFHGDLSVNESGILITENTRLGEIARDGEVSFTFTKNTLKHILSGHHTIGVRAIRIDGQEQYTLVLKGSDLCEEIDITALRNLTHTITDIEKLTPGLEYGREIPSETFTKAQMILRSLLSGGMNDSIMVDIRGFGDVVYWPHESRIYEPAYEASNNHLARSYKSAHEMAIREVHVLKFVISQLAKKDPAEARPLQESINWIKHELDSRNTNDDLVNAIWFVFKRTEVLKDIYNLVELNFLIFLVDTVLDVEEAVFNQSDNSAYPMDESIIEFRNNRSNQYYVELPHQLWEPSWMGMWLPSEYRLEGTLDVFNTLYDLINELSRS